jgi:phage shock protein A
MSVKQKESNPITSIDKTMDELASQQQRLVLMELDLKNKCDEYDKKCIDLQAREANLEKQKKVFEKKYATLSDSDSFGEMVKLIDQVYTLYVSSHNSDKGLYDSIKLLLDARERFNTKSD